MKVLFLTEGDAERSAGAGSGTPQSVIRGLRELGHEVHAGDADLYGPAKAIAAAATFAPARARWAVRYHVQGAPFQLRSRAARRAVRTHGRGLDAVLQYGATFDPGRRVPYFLYCDSTMRIAERYPRFSWAGQLTRREIDGASEREGAVYRGARRIFTFSDHVGDLLASDFGIPRERVRTVYAGPNFDVAQTRARRWGADVPPNVLFVGREFERKGGDVLLRAFARVREALPGATLTIVGPRELSVDQPGVTALGFLNKDDPADYARLVHAYQTAALFCFPTRFEPFGLAVLEAMYFGLPCVATRAWAIPEMVVDGQTGYTVPDGDAGGFADGMLRVLADPALASRFGTAARARAEAHFSWAAVTRTMADVIAEDLAAL